MLSTPTGEVDPYRSSSSHKKAVNQVKSTLLSSHKNVQRYGEQIGETVRYQSIKKKINVELQKLLLLCFMNLIYNSKDRSLCALFDLKKEKNEVPLFSSKYGDLKILEA